MNKKRILIITIFFAALLTLAIISLILSNHVLMISRYSVAANCMAEPVRIVQLTDLHNSVFGAHNRRLLKRVAAQQPDMILITGDLLNANEERTDIATELIEQLAPIAPVYVSLGNHEKAYEQKYGADLKKLYSDAGATVLDKAWEDVRVNGQEIRIGGVYGYCMPARFLNSGGAWRQETEFMEAFQDTELPKILLCHMPYSWLVHGSLDSWDADCVLCGHIHGGQVRIPWIGGLWAPDQGWLPGRVCGLYWSADGSRVMALSRGLGNTDKYPRFNNIPEILVLDLIPAE